MRSKHVLRIVGALLAIGLMAWLIARIGWDEIVAQLLAAGPGFTWILVLHVFATAVIAIPWYLLLPRRARPSLWHAVISRFVSTGANAVLPLFGFAGDLVRLWWLRRDDHAAGVAALVVDRLVYGAASAALLGAGLVALLQATALPSSYALAAGFGALGLLALVAIGAVVGRRYRLAGRIHRLIQRMRRRVEDGELGDEIDRNVEDMLRRRRTLGAGFLLHVGGKVVLGLELYIGFALLDVGLAWDEVIVLTALPVALSITGVLVPSQLGVQEGATALVAASYGISPATAVAVVLMLRLRMLFGAAVVMLLLLFHKPPARHFTGTSEAPSQS